MKTNWCKMCYCAKACTEPCKMVLAELRSKGVYDMDPRTNELIHKVNGKHRNIKIIFMYDPYSDTILGLDDDLTAEQ